MKPTITAAELEVLKSVEETARRLRAAQIELRGVVSALVRIDAFIDEPAVVNAVNDLAYGFCGHAEFVKRVGVKVED